MGRGKVAAAAAAVAAAAATPPPTFEGAPPSPLKKRRGGIPRWVLGYCILWVGIIYIFCLPFLGGPPPGTQGLYRTLQISPHEAEDEAQLKKAYRKLARELHPDKHISGSNWRVAARATKRFEEVSHAYTVLSDPLKKDIYSRLGEEGLKRHADGDPSVMPGFKRGYWAAGSEPGHRQPNLWAWDSIDDVVTSIFSFIERRLTGS